MRYRLILFDADGTLLDFRKGQARALESAFREFDLAFDPDRDPRIYSRINEELWREFEADRIDRETLRYERFRKFSTEIGFEFDPDQFSESYLGYLSEAAFLIPGAIELVQSLKGRAALVLITNGFSRVQRPRLENSPLADSFDYVVISDELGCKKPEAGIFLDVFSRFPGISRRETVILGDGLASDILGGIRVGIDTCWYNPQQDENSLGLSPTCEVRTLEQAHEFLAKADQDAG